MPCLSGRANISGSAPDSKLCVLNVGSELHRTQDRKLRYEFTWLTSRDPFKLVLIMGFELNKGTENFNSFATLLI